MNVQYIHENARYQNEMRSESYDRAKRKAERRRLILEDKYSFSSLVTGGVDDEDASSYPELMERLLRDDLLSSFSPEWTTRREDNASGIENNAPSWRYEFDRPNRDDLAPGGFPGDVDGT